MRLIDADALIESIKNTADLGGWIGEALYQIKQVAIKYIDSAPSIEPKHGEWEDIDNWWESNEEIHLFRCSVCGAEMNSPIEPNFCCSCGADMRKETVDYKRVVLTCDDEGNWSMCGERKEGE